ncbi:hypothetical protein [Paenibacillus methanolicus]|uniref:Membrane protein DUF2207 n=1 Tax=Paenibacillus methanolicus TaxID=582686 RepID=A0A5S5BRJ8_9BACL|nr:hypothetical protein [Paenibacillus methanolicus]TYP69699.1 hypothetical protein BCM02_11328 [Paenibacillus methanolicus]
MKCFIRASARLVFLALLACLFAVQQTGEAHANGGALSWPPAGQGPLRFDEDSGIALTREKIVYEIDRERHDIAHVGVEYVLRNGKGQQKDIELLFITPSSPEKEFHVREGERVLEKKAISNVQLDNWMRSEAALEVVEPLSGKVLRYRERSPGTWSGERPVMGYSFRLSFAAGEEKTVTMGYPDYAGFHRIGVVQPLHSYLYYMTPAAFWEGETAVELELRVPDRKFRVHSSIPLTKLNGVTYGAKLGALPQAEWRLSVVDASGLIYGTNSPLRHNLISLLIVLIAAAGLFYAALRLRQSLILAAGTPALIAFTYFYVHSVSSDKIIDFLAVWMIRVVMAGLLAACWLVAWMKIRRRKAAETTTHR